MSDALSQIAKENEATKKDSTLKALIIAFAIRLGAQGTEPDTEAITLREACITASQKIDENNRYSNWNTKKEGELSRIEELLLKIEQRDTFIFFRLFTWLMYDQISYETIFKLFPGEARIERGKPFSFDDVVTYSESDFLFERLGNASRFPEHRWFIINTENKHLEIIEINKDWHKPRTNATPIFPQFQEPISLPRIPIPKNKKELIYVIFSRFNYNEPSFEERVQED